MKSPNPAQYSSTSLILFGITGDLSVKKIIPALFHLHDKKLLPRTFNVIGFARRDLTNETLREFIVEVLAKHKEMGDLTKITKNVLDSFLQIFTYYKGDFESLDAYNGLSKMLEAIDTKQVVYSNKLFYLSVPPNYYEKMLQNLSDSQLTTSCGTVGAESTFQDTKSETLDVKPHGFSQSLHECHNKNNGWTRVLVEKPFGADLKTARELEDMLSNLFEESQIYRIDHYLGKEMMQDILLFRFANNLLEASWNKDVIESIEIIVAEDIGIENRANFYDGVGALRDMGQSHLLQMLALVTMEDPVEFTDKNVREARAHILEKLKTYSVKEIKQNTIRKQYKGYLELEKVKKDSTTETYFKVLAFLDTPRWRDVPITIESGKKLEAKDKKIVITFKDREKQKNERLQAKTQSPIFQARKLRSLAQNRVTFDLDGEDAGIYIDFWAKKIGFDFELEKKTLSFKLCKDAALCGIAEEYEKLLIDCILGNQILFVSSAEIDAMWKFVDPIVCAWQENEVPLELYEEGSSF